MDLVITNLFQHDVIIHSSSIDAEIYFHFPLPTNLIVDFPLFCKNPGLNSEISYSIQTDNKNSSEFFHIDENEGTVYLKVRWL